MNLLKLIKGYKTYIVSGLMVGVGLVNLATGDITFAQFLTSPDVLILLNGLGLGAVRDAIGN